jgi:hypothetical protein
VPASRGHSRLRPYVAPFGAEASQVRKSKTQAIRLSHLRQLIAKCPHQLSLRCRLAAAASAFHLHFTPTSASWLNMVERLFRDLTTRRVRAGTFKGVAELEAAIADYLRHHNARSKPFIWIAKAADILASQGGSR